MIELFSSQEETGVAESDDIYSPLFGLVYLEVHMIVLQKGWQR